MVAVASHCVGWSGDVQGKETTAPHVIPARVEYRLICAVCKHIPGLYLTSFPDLIRFLVWGYGDHEIILLINLRNNSRSEGHTLNLMNAKNLIDTNRYITQMYDYAYRKYCVHALQEIMLS